MRGQEHFISMFQMFIYLVDWTRRGCPWLVVQIVIMEITVHQGGFNISQVCSGDKSVLQAHKHKFIPVVHPLRMFFTSLSSLTEAEYLVIY